MIKAVLERLKQVRVEKVIVASTSGKTAVELCRALDSKAKVIAVSYERMKEEYARELVQHRAKIVERMPISHSIRM